MDTSVNRRIATVAGGSTARHDAALGLYLLELAARCVARWPLLLALLAVSGLLLVFLRVVQEGVRQGDLRRVAVAAHADALWRCTVISQRAQRESCRALLSSATTGAAEVPGR